AQDPLVDRLVTDFGANYVFALDLLDQYRRDRHAVEGSWREYFDRLMGVASSPEAPAFTTVKAQETASTAPSRALVRPAETQPAAPASRSRALVVPAILPGDIATPIRGGALRIVENMEASLTLPVATSLR